MSDFSKSLTGPQDLCSIDTLTLKTKLHELKEELDDVHAQFLSAVFKNTPDCFEHFQGQISEMQWAILTIQEEVDYRKPPAVKTVYH